jgi:hypothetical protein
MERWGVFSVIDHRDPIRLATEVLLYDKLAVPTPEDREGPDWKRWQDEKWDPEGLERVLAVLRPRNLVQETKWDATRQDEWATLLAPRPAPRWRRPMPKWLDSRTVLKFAGTTSRRSGTWRRDCLIWSRGRR